MGGVDLRSIIVKIYQAKVDKAEIPNELKRALRSHERVPKFVDNLTRELRQVKGLRMDQIKDATESLTEFFIKNVEAMAESRVISVLEADRINREYEAKRILAMEAEAEALEWKKKIDAQNAKNGDAGSRERTKLKVV